MGSWAVQGLDQNMLDIRENLTLDWSHMLHTAIQRFHQSMWVGILEHLDEGLELLQYQTGLQVYPIGKGAFNATQITGISPWERGI